ncbi:carbohydrate esterase family 5 [Trichoderma arundinaceum]|uniref:Carbohydrate esterase family 5 n=1 Tax=Trichoderma arundinaceum TaxID=490622 RepID=A0A395ND22_TRIAR|nr:carbohydrate esterase family 5 [Trichoderma arundinaceum]
MRGLALSFALLAASSTAAAATSSSSSASCAKGLYLVVARGSEEPAGTGVTGNLTSQIAAKVPNSQVVAVDYPATLDDYEDSEGKGVQAMQKLLSEYGQACPGSKIAVLGYSQGAQVSSDSICGGAGEPFIEDKAISAEVMDSVVAVAIFGDPTHVANLTYDRGTSVRDGIFNRTASSLATCKSYASRIISYCDTGDIYCDSGSNATVHHLYIQRYGNEIVDFVVDQFEKATSTGSSSSTTASPTASPTPSSTGGSGSGSGSGSNSTSPTKTGSAPSTTPTSGANALAPAASSLIFGAGLLAALTAMSQML